MIADEAAAIAGEAVADKKCFLCSRRLIQMESASCFLSVDYYFVHYQQKPKGQSHKRKFYIQSQLNVPGVFLY